MFKNSVFLIAVVALCGLANAEVINFGRCPKGIQVVPDFQVGQYMGVWHEQARYPMIFEDDGKCNTADYSLDTDGVLVNNSMINTNSGLWEVAIGQAKLVANGKLKVSFSMDRFFAPSSNYCVLDTDYTSYSCVYSCQPLLFTHITYAWILTREQNPSEETLQKCKDVFSLNKVSLEPFDMTVQTDC